MKSLTSSSGFSFFLFFFFFFFIFFESSSSFSIGSKGYSMTDSFGSSVFSCKGSSFGDLQSVFSVKYELDFSSFLSYPISTQTYFSSYFSALGNSFPATIVVFYLYFCPDLWLFFFPELYLSADFKGTGFSASFLYGDSSFLVSLGSF